MPTKKKLDSCIVCDRSAERLVGQRAFCEECLEHVVGQAFRLAENGVLDLIADHRARLKLKPLPRAELLRRTSTA